MSQSSASIRQQALAAHLRDPDGAEPPHGIDPARLSIYRELFFANIEGLLSGFFPVLRSLYEPADWLGLVRAFYAGHCGKTPYFLEIAGEFVAFLEEGYAARACDPPYLRDLAHYEWLELVLDIADEEIPAIACDRRGDLLRGVPVVNPLSVLARYEWPVHRVSATNPQVAPAVTWLLVWRTGEDEVRFQVLNEAAALLFASLRDNGNGNGAGATGATVVSGERVLSRVAEALGQAVSDDLLEGGRQQLSSWLGQQVVLGPHRR